MLFDICFYQGEFCAAKKGGSYWSREEQTAPFVLMQNQDVPDDMKPTDTVRINGVDITGEQLGFIEDAV